MLSVNTKWVNIFVDFYMPIFNEIYTVVRNVWYVYSPSDNKFTIKTHGRKLEVNEDNYREIFTKRKEIANEWRDWYYEQFNEEVEENASTNGKR